MNKAPAAQARRRLYFFGGAAVAVAVIAVLALLGIRQKQVRDELKSRAATVKAGPRVSVVAATMAPPERTVELTGEARPYATVTLFAKVSGYLREIRVDKGDGVAKGQLLAVIESPELDRQYEAALADARNKRIFADREVQLLKDGVVAQQDVDNAESAARVAEANVAAFEVQKGYEVLRAPFAARVTARFADPGALVQNATTSQTTTLPLVILSRTDRLRIYVYLDQRNASFVRVGDQAVVADVTRPEVRIVTRVSRVSGELDPKSRTLLVELDLDNRQEKILAGGFVQVALKLRTPSYVQVPVEALLMQGEKAFVGVVDADSRVTFRPVTVADSDGKAVRLGSGLAEGERVVLNPGTGIVGGEVVQPVGAEGR